MRLRPHGTPSKLFRSWPRVLPGPGGSPARAARARHPLPRPGPVPRGRKSPEPCPRPGQDEPGQGHAEREDGSPPLPEHRPRDGRARLGCGLPLRSGPQECRFVPPPGRGRQRRRRHRARHGCRRRRTGSSTWGPEAAVQAGGSTWRTARRWRGYSIRPADARATPPAGRSRRVEARDRSLDGLTRKVTFGPLHPCSGPHKLRIWGANEGPGVIHAPGVGRSR